ncbi:MAG: hypothetical protein HY544_00520 [Candidatus Diapherotrites archaeon]|uniref:Uncharacterized protein n=1 Tax=Candidatus Iainarchaeum sp. TaxID=3101447 RepID=A0A8T3YKY9_9ARCH|nr:hypothetical protein [Candidatus Diapherotrites archaeon]
MRRLRPNRSNASKIRRDLAETTSIVDEALASKRQNDRGRSQLMRQLKSETNICPEAILLSYELGLPTRKFLTKRFMRRPIQEQKKIIGEISRKLAQLRVECEIIESQLNNLFEGGIPAGSEHEYANLILAGIQTASEIFEPITKDFLSVFTAQVLQKMSVPNFSERFSARKSSNLFVSWHKVYNSLSLAVSHRNRLLGIAKSKH